MMKKMVFVLTMLSWVFVLGCIYFMFYADAGPDGLGTFFSIIINGILCLFFAVIAIVQLWRINGITRRMKLVYSLLIVLPFLILIGRTFFPMIDPIPLEQLQ